MAVDSSTALTPMVAVDVPLLEGPIGTTDAPTTAAIDEMFGLGSGATPPTAALVAPVVSPAAPIAPVVDQAPIPEPTPAPTPVASDVVLTPSSPGSGPDLSGTIGTTDPAMTTTIDNTFGLTPSTQPVQGPGLTPDAPPPPGAPTPLPLPTPQPPPGQILPPTPVAGLGEPTPVNSPVVSTPPAAGGVPTPVGEPGTTDATGTTTPATGSVVGTGPATNPVQGATAPSANPGAPSTLPSPGPGPGPQPSPGLTVPTPAELAEVLGPFNPADFGLTTDFGTPQQPATTSGAFGFQRPPAALPTPTDPGAPAGIFSPSASAPVPMPSPGPEAATPGGPAAASGVGSPPPDWGRFTFAPPTWDKIQRVGQGDISALVDPSALGYAAIGAPASVGLNLPSAGFTGAVALQPGEALRNVLGQTLLGSRVFKDPLANYGFNVAANTALVGGVDAVGNQIQQRTGFGVRPDGSRQFSLSSGRQGTIFASTAALNGFNEFVQPHIDSNLLGELKFDGQGRPILQNDGDWWKYYGPRAGALGAGVSIPLLIEQYARKADPRSLALTGLLSSGLPPIQFLLTNATNNPPRDENSIIRNVIGTPIGQGVGAVVNAAGKAMEETNDLPLAATMRPEPPPGQGPPDNGPDDGPDDPPSPPAGALVPAGPSSPTLPGAAEEALVPTGGSVTPTRVITAPIPSNTDGVAPDGLTRFDGSPLVGTPLVGSPVTGSPALASSSAPAAASGSAVPAAAAVRYGQLPDGSTGRVVRQQPLVGNGAAGTVPGMATVVEGSGGQRYLIAELPKQVRADGTTVVSVPRVAGEVIGSNPVAEDVGLVVKLPAGASGQVTGVEQVTTRTGEGPLLRFNGGGGLNSVPGMATRSPAPGNPRAEVWRITAGSQVGPDGVVHSALVPEGYQGQIDLSRDVEITVPAGTRPVVMTQTVAPVSAPVVVRQQPAPAPVPRPVPAAAPVRQQPAAAPVRQQPAAAPAPVV
ncbi:MAG: hypothetical protein AVDCRST_MAG66-2368, partial [uncultured Pseudonocardia sp.]